MLTTVIEQSRNERESDHRPFNGQTASL
jgi:hypothetical protein